MPSTRLSQIQTIFLVLFLLLIGLALTRSPGTTDVDIWRTWTKNADSYGLVAGFAANQADYPPLSSAILFGGYRFFSLFDIDLFLSIKLTILVFLLLSTLIFWIWTRNLVVTLLLYGSLLLNSLGLGYVDIFFAPFLAASLWMLHRRKLVWFSLFFSLAFMTKWQPILISPFILVYLLDIQEFGRWKEIALKPLLFKVLLPSAGLLGLIVMVYRFQPIWQAFIASISHQYLSGNALNLGWIITHFLHVLQPNEYGGLVNNLSNYIMTDDTKITLVPRLLFFTTYLVLLSVFFRREKSLENLLLFSTAGFLMYFCFNTGVHENHLFLLMIPAAALLWIDRKHWLLALLLILINNANLFLFYGVDGILHLNRSFLNTDIALPMSISVVLFSLLMAGWLVFPSKQKTVR